MGASAGDKRAEWIRRLQAAGLRATQPRLQVLEVLEEIGPHHSVDEIVAALAARGKPLPRMSVYNVVGALVAHGLLMATDAGPGRALYELSERWHHHFVCRDCGAIIDVPCVVGEKPCLRPGTLDADVDEAQVIFRGRCAACRARSRPVPAEAAE